MLSCSTRELPSRGSPTSGFAERCRPITTGAGENAPPGTSIAYYMKGPASGPITITIRPAGSTEVFRTIAGTGYAGLNQVRWDLHPVLAVDGVYLGT